MAQNDKSQKGSIVHQLDSLNQASDKDVALSFVGERAQSYDASIEASVLRKLDRFFLPILGILWALQYYDKAILGNAALLGMTSDLSLTVVKDQNTKPATVSTFRLSWATSLVYFGTLTGLYPLTLAVQRFKPGRLLGIVVVLWAGTVMATAGVTSWQGLYIQRFFLGFLESVIPTAASMIISSYYTQREQALRQSAWLWTPGIAKILGGLLNYGFAHVRGGSLDSWQYLYLLAGVLTLLLGLPWLAIPDSPVTAWFLSHEERIVAVERLRNGQTGVKSHKIKITQMIEALRDIKLWLLFLMSTLTWVANGAITGFGPLIVSAFGWNSFQSILLQCPQGAFTSVSILLPGYLSSRIPNSRIILLILFCLPTIAGFVMIWKSTWSHHAATPLVGYSIIGCFSGVGSQIFALAMSNVAGATKKSCMAASVWAGFVVGNIIGPQFVNTETRKEHFPMLWRALISCYCIVIALAILLYEILRRANKQKCGVQDVEAERDKMAFQDLTDKENPYFRYVL